MLWITILICFVHSAFQENNIVVLTDENFTEGIKDKEALVIFYYSQCGSSRFAFDEFKKAALYFNNTENFVMGSIDIYNYPNVPKAFQVYTNPKILFFSDEDHYEYKFPITAQNIISYVESKLTPRLKKVEIHQLDSFLAPGIISFILFDEENSKLERKLSKSLRFYDYTTIAHCTDPLAPKKYGLKPGFYAINTYHNITDQLQDFTFEKIIDFVLRRDLHKKLPLSVSYDLVLERQLPAVYLFRDESSNKKYEKIINNTLAYLNDFRIVYGDLNANIIFSRIIGFPASSQPALMLIDPIGNNLQKFLPNSKEISKNSIIGLIDS